MRPLVTAITVAALTFSLVAQATPAAAVTGYDSSYAGESAFLSLDQGDDGSFTVFFSNTGATTWTRGSSTQVNLATCLEDKVTCNQQDADEAEFNDGWLSVTAYATHTQSSVASGSLGTFTYNVTVPADAAEDTYRFNGALVLSSTGQDIHNEGYFQEATVRSQGAAAVLTDLEPEEGSTAGGDTVTITGRGFVCSPEPQVLFDAAAAEVLECVTTELSVVTPAHSAGTVDVTVVNRSAAVSNALTFTFADDVRPTFVSATAEGQSITLEFSEAVCAESGTLTAQTELIVRVDGAEVTEQNISFGDCADDEFSEIATLTVLEDVPAGVPLSVTITTTGADDIFDQDENAMDFSHTETAIAEADETDPTMKTVTAGDEQTLEIEYDEPVECDGTDRGQFVFDPDDPDEDDLSPNTAECDGSTTVTLHFPTDTFAGGVTGVLEYRADDDPIVDSAGNRAPNESMAIVPITEDDPTIEDARITASDGLRNTADDGDEITLVFSEDMHTSTAGEVIRVQDDDGTIADIRCTSVATADNDLLDATCAYDNDELTLELLEDGTGDTIADGDTVGLQWPADIIDTSNVKDEEMNDVDLDGSEDITIDHE